MLNGHLVPNTVIYKNKTVLDIGKESIKSGWRDAWISSKALVVIFLVVTKDEIQL
jgi:hypothetical protein